MMAMLDYLELDTEVSGTDTETIECDDYKKMSRNDRDTNGILAITQGEVRFSYKDRQKFIDLFT